MPRSKHRKRLKTKSRQSNNKSIASEPLHFLVMAEFSTVIMNFTYVGIALYFLNTTDKISIKSKLAVNLMLLTISAAGVITSSLSKREHKKVNPSIKKLEKLAKIKLAFSLLLSIAAGFLPAYLSRYPKEIEEFITVTFPGINNRVAEVVSKVVTFLTTGFIGLLTTLLLNILSSYIYDKIKQSRTKNKIRKCIPEEDLPM
jgi:transcriptional regulator with XRE-family HTH domain